MFNDTDNQGQAAKLTRRSAKRQHDMSIQDMIQNFQLEIEATERVRKSRRGKVN